MQETATIYCRERYTRKGCAGSGLARTGCFLTVLCEEGVVMSTQKFDDNENFVIQRSAIAKRDTENLQSLTVLIPPQLRQQFLKKLFHSDLARFEKLLAQLEVAPDWVVAHRLIEAYYYLCQINPYQNEATRFSDLIYKRYFPKDEYI